MEDTTYLSHHGVLGQKWGVRRYRDENGQMTLYGKKAKKVYEQAATTNY